MEGVNLLGFVVQKSNVVMVGGKWFKPIIRHNFNSTLGGVELTWSGDGDGVEMELGVELELGNRVIY